MPASAFDSAIYRDLLVHKDLAELFTDSAEIRAMLITFGALARAQAKHGLIPEISAQAIHRASLDAMIDPGALAQETGQSAVVVPALVKAFRAEIPGPDHAQYVHWGATSQDIMDTGLILRLRKALGVFETDLDRLIKALGTLAASHADLPIAARTYGQTATVTSFGAVVASWGAPVLRHRDRLDAMKTDLLCVSLSGAAGTLSAMGAGGPAIRAEMATLLGLRDPKASWHSQRDRITALSGWATALAQSLGKIGEDLTLLTQTERGEIRLPQAGGSSTMPQKNNPVAPSLLVALARHIAGLNTTLQTAAIHREQRDGAAWITEWLTLPQLCLGAGQMIDIAADLAAGLTPIPTAMMRNIDDGLGLIYAEALSFAMAAHIPRPEAQAEVKTLCQTARDTGTPLSELAAKHWPDHDFATLFTPSAGLGTAPAEARDFAAQASTI